MRPRNDPATRRTHASGSASAARNRGTTAGSLWSRWIQWIRADAALSTSSGSPFIGAQRDHDPCMSTLRVANSHSSGSTPRTARNSRVTDAVSSAIATLLPCAVTAGCAVPSRTQAAPATITATTHAAAVRPIEVDMLVALIAERFRGDSPDLRIRVLQHPQQRLDGLRAADFGKRLRRGPAHFGVAVACESLQARHRGFVANAAERLRHVLANLAVRVGQRVDERA